MMRARTLFSRALGVLGVAASVGSALAPDTAAAAIPDPPPIVVVSIDTLRSDRLTAYGAARVATPAIDRLARDGIVFEHAFSQVPLTLPSHLSFFTGLLPADHGVRDNTGYRFDAAAHPWAPTSLRSAGYVTGGFASAYVLRPETGIAAGFGTYDAEIDLGTSSDLAGAQRSGRVTIERAIAWLRAHRRERVFLFVHLYEPHSPYRPEPPFDRDYADPYDGEIATADARLGELVAELDRLGIYDRALVVLLSDHGEGLGDHGEREHGLLLYREALQVPLVLKLPGGVRGGERVAAAAQTLDLAPTLLAAAGLPADERQQGIDLRELGRGDGPTRRIVSETFYPRLHYGWSELVSVVDFPYQLIEGPDPELFDLVADPASKKNLRDDERRTFHALRAVARERTVAPAPPMLEDAETARKLAALGYLSGAPQSDGPRRDPKSGIGLLDALQQGRIEVVEGQVQRALPRLEELIREAPEMVDAWVLLGDARRLFGDFDAALAAYREALERSPASANAALGAAGVLRDLGRLDDARRHAELALAASPATAHRMLAEIALSARDAKTAELEARRAIEEGAELAGRILLARAEIAAKRPEEALAELERAEARIGALGEGSRDYAGLHMARGDAYLTSGRAADAAAAYRKEIETFPDAEAGYMSLAILYRIEGKPAEAVRVLRTLVARNPERPNAYHAAAATLLKLGAPTGAREVLQEGLRRFPENQKLLALARGEP